MDQLVIRQGTEDDFPFILNSWLKSHCESKILSPYLPREMYFHLHHPILEAILARPTTKISMAVNTEDPTLIYGYCVYEILKSANVFHYVYVKRAFNGFGIATDLINSMPFKLDNVYVTHLTHVGRKLAAKYDFTYCFYFLYPVEKSNG